LVAQAEKLIRDNADKVSEDDKSWLESKISAVKEVLSKSDIWKEELEAKSKELNDELMKVWQKLYSQPWSSSADENTSNGQKSDDWVVDGEVETDGNTTRV
jgi:molecular chaperone DnaK